MGQQENNAYPPGTIVFAKLKGYPWWPAKIEDERAVPAKVMKQKTKTKSPIWTVFFFGSRDYGFFGPDSIRPFDKVNVEKDLKAKKFKTKDLEMAVREALDPTLLEEEEEQEEEGDDDNEEEEEQEKAPQGKKKPKATGAAITGMTGKGGKKASTSKATSASTTKKTKAAKASSEEDADTQSVNSNHSSNKRGVSEDDKADKKKRRKSMSIEKEDQQSNGSDRPSASPVTPRRSEDGLNNKAHESLEITRDFKRLYHLRHRLQKLMYEKKQGDIPLEDYPKISSALKDVEEAPMTYDLLRHTKIGKVVKCGIGYEFENDTEYNIHERCQQLMRKWKDSFVDSKDQAKASDTTDGHNKESASTLQE